MFSALLRSKVALRRDGLVLFLCGVVVAGTIAPAAHGFYVDDHDIEVLSRTQAAPGVPSELGNDQSLAKGVSTDGRYVLFISRATNLPVGEVPDGESTRVQIFRKDRTTGAIDLVARSTRFDAESERTFCGTTGANAGMSADGRYVAFGTDEQLVPADTNFNSDVYVRDMTKSISTAADATRDDDAAGTWELVSARDGGDVPAGYEPTLSECSSFGLGSILPPSGEVISDDGRRVIFISSMFGVTTDLPNRPTADGPRGSLFWRDLDANATRSVARESSDASTAGVPVGIDAPEPVPVTEVAISGDGTKVAWVGKYGPSQVRIADQEYLSRSQDPTVYHTLWRDMSLGGATQTRRVIPLVDFDDPNCTETALEALTHEQLQDSTSQSSPCMGPLVHDPSSDSGAGDLALGKDGLTIAWTMVGRLRPGANAGNSSFGRDAWVTTMAPGVSRKAGTRVITRAATDTTSPGTGATVVEVALSGDGRKLALTTQRTNFSSLTAPSPVGPLPLITSLNVFRVTLASDRTPELLELVSRSTSGGDISVGLEQPASGEGLLYSGDGTAIVFGSVADNLFEGDANEVPDVFVSVPKPVVDPCANGGPGCGGNVDPCANGGPGCGGNVDPCANGGPGCGGNADPCANGGPGCGNAPPVPKFKLASAKPGRNGVLSLSLTAPGAGSLQAVVKVKGRLPKARKSRVLVYGRASARVGRAGGIKLTLKPSRTGKQLLRGKRSLSATLIVTFRPSKGRAVTHQQRVTLRASKR